MTKLFCDICEKPTEKRNMDIALDISKKFPIKKGSREHGAKIEVSLSFRFSEHPGGYGGPPDLCKFCRSKIVAELVKHIGK